MTAYLATFNLVYRGVMKLSLIKKMTYIVIYVYLIIISMEIFRSFSRFSDVKVLSMGDLYLHVIFLYADWLRLFFLVFSIIITSYMVFKYMVFKKENLQSYKYILFLNIINLINSIIIYIGLLNLAFYLELDIRYFYVKLVEWDSPWATEPRIIVSPLLFYLDLSRIVLFTVLIFFIVKNMKTIHCVEKKEGVYEK